MRLSCFVSEGYATVAQIAEAGQNAMLTFPNLIQAHQTNPEWTSDQLARRQSVETGQCVIANMHENTDEALVAWAESNDCFVRIDRRSDWGNPFEMPDDGERAEVVAKFTKFYLPYKDGLLRRMPELRGKVLGCWCYPEECHGHILAEIVNREAQGEATTEQLVDQLAEVEG